MRRLLLTLAALLIAGQVHAQIGSPHANSAAKLDVNPTDCTLPDTYATAINEFGNLTCSALPASTLTSGTTTITGGATTQLCYNQAGVIKCGDAGLTYAEGTDTLTAAGTVKAGPGSSTTPGFMMLTPVGSLPVGFYAPNDNGQFLRVVAAGGPTVNFYSVSTGANLGGIDIYSPNESAFLEIMASDDNNNTNLGNLSDALMFTQYGGTEMLFVVTDAAGQIRFATGGQALANEAWRIEADGDLTSVNANRDLYLSGILSAGTGPTTLTDAAGKVLSAALNTVAAAQGGTGQTVPTDDNVLVGDGSAWAKKAVTDCVGAGKAVTYDVSTNTWGCNTISGGSPAGSTGDIQKNNAGSFAASGLNDDASGAFQVYPNAASPQATTWTFAGARGGTDSNTAGVLTKYNGSVSTGTGLGGGFEFDVANKGSTGTTANTRGPVLTLSPPNTGTTAPTNYVDIASAITGGAPTISAQGSDTNIDLKLKEKTNAVIFFNTEMAVNDSNNFITMASGTKLGWEGNAAVTRGTGVDATKLTRAAAGIIGVTNALKFIQTAGTVPTVGSNCGTGAAVTAGSTAAQGKITLGTSAGNCTVNFGVTWSGTVECTVVDTDAAGGLLHTASASTTVLTTGSASGNSSHVLKWNCFANAAT